MFHHFSRDFSGFFLANLPRRPAAWGCTWVRRWRHWKAEDPCSYHWISLDISVITTYPVLTHPLFQLWKIITIQFWLDIKGRIGIIGTPYPNLLGFLTTDIYIYITSTTNCSPKLSRFGNGETYWFVKSLGILMAKPITFGEIPGCGRHGEWSRWSCCTNVCHWWGSGGSNLSKNWMVNIKRDICR